MQRLRSIPIWLYLLILAMEILLGLFYLDSFGKNQNQIDFIKAEQEGVAEIQVLLDQLVLVGQYRGTCTAMLLNFTATNDAEQRCSDRYSAIKNHLNNADRDRLSGTTIHEIGIPSADVEAAVFFEQVTQFSLDNIDEILQIYTLSNLKLDPADNSYSLAAIYAKQIPWLIELVGQIRGKTSLFMTGRISRGEFRQSAGQLLQVLNETESEFAYINLRDLSGEHQQLKEMFAQTKSVIDRYISEIEYRQTLVRLEPTDNYYIYVLFQTGTEIIAQLNQIDNVAREILLLELEERFNNYKNEKLSIFASGLVVQLLLIYLILKLVNFFSDLQLSRLQAERSKEKLQALLEKQEKLFAIVGHELRTPAASLKMLLDQVTEQKGDPILSEAKSTSQHLLDVIDDMRISTSTALTLSANDRQPLSVFKILQEVTHSTASMADQHRISVHLESKKVSNTEHYGSAKFIRQLALNLIKNGLIHSQGSDLWVSLASKTTNNPDATRFCIQIVDNGVGIPDEDQARLFEAFERGKSKSEGTGLGLHICRQLARSLSDGALIYKPNIPQGSIFELNFTLEKVSSEHRSLEDADVNLLKDRKILVVEDTPTLRMLSCRILQNQGAIVTEACDGAEGLAKAAEDQFDIIITDIMMPEMDGYEMTAALRKRGYSGPIIGVTGATVGDEAEKLHDAGANSVLPKPLTIPSLNAELAKISTL